jgi:hypothetical protein
MDASLIKNLHISDIASAIHYCSFYPKQTYGYAFIFSLTGYLGIQVSTPPLFNFLNNLAKWR